MLTTNKSPDTYVDIDSAGILIVTDDTSTKLSLEHAVRDLGRVHTAMNGSEALEMYRKKSFDYFVLMFVDIGLTDMSCYELIDQLDDNQSCIILSDDNNHNNYIRAFKSKVRAFLSKPIQPFIAKKIIKAILKDDKVNKPLMKIPSRHIDNLLNLLSDAVIVSDEDGVIKSANPYALNLFGYASEELIGKNVNILTPEHIRVEHAKYINEHKKTSVAKLIGKSRELGAVTKSGKSIHIELNISEFWENNKKSYVAVIRDITEKKLLQDRILKSSFYDSLTGLRSSTALMYDFEHLSQTELGDGYISAVMLDIDELQEINSVFGYNKGDQILIALGKMVKEFAEAFSAEAYRVSGDRFITACSMTVQETTLENQKKCIQCLENEIASLTDMLGVPLSITAVFLSRPIFYFQDHSLLQILEMTIFSARSQGYKGKVWLSNETGLDYGLEQKTLSMKLKSDLDIQTLDVVIQPKVDRHERIVSAEILLRWKDPEYKLLNLADFISAAESTGAIIKIGEYVLKRVCEFLSSLPAEKRVKIFINLSIRQFGDDELIDKIKACCNENNIPYSLIGFELTESMIAGDMDILSAKLLELVSSGFEVAVDDFGTGQSNLKYIHKLPISVIKIDKSFIDEINGEGQSCPIVDAVISMAEKMGRSTVAEGVESRFQAEYLWAKGVDEIQGYYYHRPIPLDAFFKLLM